MDMTLKVRRGRELAKRGIGHESAQEPGRAWREGNERAHLPGDLHSLIHRMNLRVAPHWAAVSIKRGDTCENALKI